MSRTGASAPGDHQRLAVSSAQLHSAAARAPQYKPVILHMQLSNPPAVASDDAATSRDRLHHTTHRDSSSDLGRVEFAV
jgi:hypothetical protein